MNSPEQPRNPLHGITLERMLNELVDHFGWAGLGDRIPVRCFNLDPSISSSLRFLRKPPWAREKGRQRWVAGSGSVLVRSASCTPRPSVRRRPGVQRKRSPAR